MNRSFSKNVDVLHLGVREIKVNMCYFPFSACLPHTISPLSLAPLSALSRKRKMSVCLTESVYSLAWLSFSRESLNSPFSLLIKVSSGMGASAGNDKVGRRVFWITKMEKIIIIKNIYIYFIINFLILFLIYFFVFSICFFVFIYLPFIEIRLFIEAQKFFSNINL